MNIEQNKSLVSLLEREHLVIPDYQRDYAQGRLDEKIRETRTHFVSDLIDGSTGRTMTHTGLVYGATNPGLEGFVAVDGQQRLTTIFLFHLYIAKRILDREPENARARRLLAVLQRFGWNARIYASEFTEFLFDHKWDFQASGTLTAGFRRSSDYYTIWESDPTVCNMLVMLDEIHAQMCDRGDELDTMLENLFSEGKCGVVFDYKKLIDGTDEFQYQKMNSRGRDLTTYELFKQKLQTEVSLAESFKDKMDKEWLCFFDDRAGEDREPDVCYQNFINETALFYGIKDLGEDYAYTDRIMNSKPKGTRTDTGFVNFPAYASFIDNIEEVERYFDWIAEHFEAVCNTLDQMRYEGEIASLAAIFDEPTWYVRAVNFAVYFYARGREFVGFDQAEFGLWWRPLHNLIFNTEITGANFHKFVRAFEKFPKAGVDEYIIGSEIDFFSNYQVREEKKKCLMIQQNEQLRERFKLQEHRRRFQGQIGILLPDDAEPLCVKRWDRIVAAFNSLTDDVYDHTASDFDFIASMLSFVPDDESWSGINFSLKYVHGNVRGGQIPARWIHRMLFHYINILDRHPLLGREVYFRYCRWTWRLRQSGRDYHARRNLAWVNYVYENYTEVSQAYHASESKNLRFKDGNVWLYHKKNKNERDILLSNRRMEIIERLYHGQPIADGHDRVVYDHERHNLKIVFSSTNIWIGIDKENPVEVPEVLPEGIESGYWYKAWQWFDWSECNNFYERNGQTFDEYVSCLKIELERWMASFLSRLNIKGGPTFI